MTTEQPKRHRHEQSMWLIAGGRICWCYQCGAWTLNTGNYRTEENPRTKWHKPSGIGGENPAMKGFK